MFLIVAVGCRRDIGKRLHLRHLTDKHHVGSEIDRLIDFGTDIGIRALSHSQSAVGDALTSGEILEFVDLTA